MASGNSRGFSASITNRAQFIDIPTKASLLMGSEPFFGTLLSMIWHAICLITLYLQN